MRIDARQSFWRYENGAEFLANQISILQQDYLPAHTEPAMIENGFHGAIIHSAQLSAAENQWLINLQHQYDFLLATVGWFDLTADQVATDIEANTAGLAGVAWQLSETDTNELDRLIDGANLLAAHDLALIIEPTNSALSTLPRLLDAIPNTTSIINPALLLRGQSSIDNWQQWLESMPQRDNLYCELTGLADNAPSDDPEDGLLDLDRIKPHFDCLHELFGSERLLFATGWPYSNLSATFDEIYDVTAALIDQLPTADQTNILGANAERCYGISKT